MKKKFDWNAPMTRKNWVVVYAASMVIGVAYAAIYLNSLGFTKNPFRKKSAADEDLKVMTF